MEKLIILGGREGGKGWGGWGVVEDIMYMNIKTNTVLARKVVTRSRKNERNETTVCWCVGIERRRERGRERVHSVWVHSFPWFVPFQIGNYSV